MEQPSISHQNSDSFSKKKLSLTSAVYKDFNFGQPHNGNNVKTNQDHYGSYPYNEMQFQLNYMPSYHNYYHHSANSFVDHQEGHDPHNMHHEKSNEKPQQMNQNNPKNKDKKKENNKQGTKQPAQNKPNTTKNEQSQQMNQNNQNNPKNKDKKKENHQQVPHPPAQNKPNTTKNEQSQPQIVNSDPAKKKENNTQPQAQKKQNTTNTEQSQPQVVNSDPAKKKENNKQGAQSQAQNKQNTTKNEQSRPQVQPQVASSDPAKKNKKKKQKEKEDFSDNPWAQPLKKALKKAAAVGPVLISNAKGNLLLKNRPEIKKNRQEEEKKDDEKEKKFKFLRVRDIRSNFYANRANKPIDRVSQLRAKNIIDLNKKKKKLSKVKKAQLRYFELQVLNAKRAQKLENLKNKKEEAEDGYETVDEEDEQRALKEDERRALVKEKKKNKKKEKKDEEKYSEGEGEERKEEPEDRKIDLSEYLQAIPELEIPDEKRPQTTYKNLKVRKWVDNILCEELDKMTFDLLNDLLRMQTIKKLIKPTKSKKRIYCGMREVLRSIMTPLTDQMARCIVIAVNIQENPLQQGGDEKMLEIIMKARMKGIPIIHACSRKQLGQACTGNDYARISVVSVANYFGADELYKNLVQFGEEKKKEFQDQLNSDK